LLADYSLVGSHIGVDILVVVVGTPVVVGDILAVAVGTPVVVGDILAVVKGCLAVEGILLLLHKPEGGTPTQPTSLCHYLSTIIARCKCFSSCLCKFPKNALSLLVARFHKRAKLLIMVKTYCCQLPVTGLPLFHLAGLYVTLWGLYNIVWGPYVAAPSVGLLCHCTLSSLWPGS